MQIAVENGEVAQHTEIIGDGARGAVIDFASDPVSNPSIVWSMNSTLALGNGFENDLISFDPFQRQMLSSVPLDVSLELIGLAIDPTSGTIYANSNSALYTLDPGTGIATLVGYSDMRLGSALAFDLSGNLYGVGNLATSEALVSIDKMTGEAQVVAQLGNSWTLDMAVRSEDGIMYAVGFSPGDGPRFYSLYQIDVSTGAVVNLGQSLFRPGGLAFTMISEPSTFALVVFAGVILVIGSRGTCRITSRRLVPQ